MTARTHPAGLLLGLLCATLAVPAAAAGDAAGSRTFDLGLDVAFEHDDNVSLGSGISAAEAEQSDWVWHTRPTLTFAVEQAHSAYGVDVTADYRKGVDTSLEELNLSAAGLVEWELEGGWDFTLFDRWVSTEFDQEVFFSVDDPAAAEPGISTSRANTYGGEVSFSPRRLLRLDLAYDDTNETVDFDNDDPALATSDERDLMHASGRLQYPVSDAVALFVAYQLEDQDASERLSRTYDDQRAVVGASWRSQIGGRLSLEAGRQEIDFVDTPDTDFDHTVGLVKYQQELGETMTLQLAGGVDGFGATVFDGLFEHQVEDLGTTRLRARKFTQKSFSSRSSSRILDAVLASFSWERRFRQSWLAALSLNFLNLQSAEDVIGGVPQDDDSLNASVRLSYDLRRPIRVAAYYRWSERRSNTPANEFTDNRLGVLVTLHN